jgi:hypothetical protein
MQDGEGLTAEQIKEFLKGNEGVSFAGQSQKEVYGWVQGVLVAQEFTQQDKKRRGAIRAYVEKVTGLGSAQVTRLPPGDGERRSRTCPPGGTPAMVRRVY